MIDCQTKEIDGSACGSSTLWSQFTQLQKASLIDRRCQRSASAVLRLCSTVLLSLAVLDCYNRILLVLWRNGISYSEIEHRCTNSRRGIGDMEGAFIFYFICCPTKLS